jgi:glucose uptake protein GlcU
MKRLKTLVALLFCATAFVFTSPAQNPYETIVCFHCGCGIALGNACMCFFQYPDFNPFAGAKAEGILP